MKKCPKCDAVNSLDREHCFKCESIFTIEEEKFVYKFPDYKPLKRRHSHKKKESQNHEETRYLSIRSIIILSTSFGIMIIQPYISVATPMSLVYLFWGLCYVVFHERKLNLIEEEKGNESSKPFLSFILFCASFFFCFLGFVVLYFLFVFDNGLKLLYM